MRYIKLFEYFDLDVKGQPIRDLHWMRNILDKLNLKCQININEIEHQPFIELKDDKHRVLIFDSGGDNDFFLTRIYKDGKIIQDFLKSNNPKTISYDELASEDIVLISSRYFQ